MLKIGDRIKIIKHYGCEGQTGVVKKIDRGDDLSIGVKLDEPRKDGMFDWRKEKWVDFPLKYFWIGKEINLETFDSNLIINKKGEK